MALTQTQVWCNDAVLVVSLVFLAFDLQDQWQEFATCKRPVQWWLLMSYAIIVGSRAVHVLGTWVSSAEPGDFMLNLRHKSLFQRALLSMTWLVLLPGFMLWTVLGSVWLWEVRTHTPRCLPGGVHLWFLLLWQAMSYMWILVHGGLMVLAWFLEWRVRRVEARLVAVEDLDSRSRWGEVSRLQAYTSLPAGMKLAGLSPDDIAALPCHIVPDEDHVPQDCPVCLSAMVPGDACRELQLCGHAFHRSCIDLWLVRSTDCPLCKQQVSRSGPV